jgi:hypothetical protein
VVLCPVLLFLVVRRWRRRMPGAVFLGCVATQGPAVLGATLARAVRTPWPAHLALMFFWLGHALYAAAVLLRLATGRPGLRRPVGGGALAISALAVAELLKADKGGSRTCGAPTTRPYCAP